MKVETTARAVADHILWSCHEHGDLISNLKLQKLLYYAEGWFLALHDRSLFAEELQAWVHGPVQPEVWRRFSSYRWEPITAEVQQPHDSSRVRKHVAEVLAAYGDISAFNLERMTHMERPWIMARGDLADDAPSRAPISRKIMREHFRGLVRGKRKTS